jgi:hypothetical protein
MVTEIVDAFVSYLTDSTPTGVMLIGAGFGMTLACIEILRIKIVALFGKTQQTIESPPAEQKPRRLTCQICEQVVEMSAFAAHIARHHTVLQAESV